MSGFTSNTLLIRIQYCYQFKYFTDLIKTMTKMVNEIWNEISNTKYVPWSNEMYVQQQQQQGWEAMLNKNAF